MTATIFEMLCTMTKLIRLMELSFRWYGPKDPVISDIRQSNANFVVTSLHQIHLEKSG